ncbi:MAG: hypothetical protein H0Z24_05995, partial [Thermosipho sp. (in: Bacteria)]|nr:hypothetical protein [Thermosipho sp. (in: thermotogales)]
MGFQRYMGQILGTDELNNPKRIKVDTNGYLKTTGDYIDSISDSISTIEVEHTEIHKGNSFSLLYKSIIVAEVSVYIQIKTGSKSVHLKPTNFSTDGDKFTIEFFENPTLTDGTTPITIINRNRTSSNTPLTVFYSDP